MNIPNLTTTKSSSDLNLPAQKTSERINEESVIDFVGEKVVEKFAFEFKAKKTESDNSIKEVIYKEAGPLDKNILKDTKVAWPAQKISDTNTSYLTKDLLHFEEDKSIDIEDKGAIPKIVALTEDLNKQKDIWSSKVSISTFSENDNNVKIASVGCEFGSFVKEKNVEQERKPMNESENQNETTPKLDQKMNMTQIVESSTDQTIFNKNISVTKDSISKRKAEVPDKLVGCVNEAEDKFSETSALPQITNVASVMSGTNQDGTSVDVLNNNLRVTSAGEITAVTPDSGEDKISDILMASSNGNASDDEWSDFVVYNPDKNCDKSE